MAHNMSRRSLLRGTLLGAGALAVPAAFAGCGTSGPSGGTIDKNVTFGSNYSDEVPKKAFAETLAKFDSTQGFTTKVNTVDHNSFQENITRYLQGSPDDAYNWFAGFRMRFFAAQGLATADRRRVGDDRLQLQRRVQEGVDGRRRQEVLRARSTTTRGRCSTARACGRRRATRSRRRSTN